MAGTPTLRAPSRVQRHHGPPGHTAPAGQTPRSWQLLPRDPTAGRARTMLPGNRPALQRRGRPYQQVLLPFSRPKAPCASWARRSNRGCRSASPRFAQPAGPQMRPVQLTGRWLFPSRRRFDAARTGASAAQPSGYLRPSARVQQLRGLAQGSSSAVRRSGE